MKAERPTTHNLGNKVEPSFLEPTITPNKFELTASEGRTGNLFGLSTSNIVQKLIKKIKSP